jgi:ABC-type dipeptide/oligopeptide/nickel transport system permease subunit
VDAVNRIGRIGVVLLALLVAVAIFAPQLAPFDPHKSSSENFLPPDPVHLLGTNDIGQDIFSELLYGTRTSLAIGFLSAAISIVIGTLIGMLAGWFEGGLDRALMKLTAFFMTIPYLPAVIILSAFTRPGLLTTSLILGVMSWPGTARIVRAETMAIKKRGYLQVCRAMGAPSGYLLFRHVVKEMWTNFARTGNPSTDKYAWKKFSGDDRQTMVFDDAIGMQKDIFGRREDLMMSWAERLGNGSSKRVC